MVSAVVVDAVSQRRKRAMEYRDRGRGRRGLLCLLDEELLELHHGLGEARCGFRDELDLAGGFHLLVQVYMDRGNAES